MQKNIFRKMLVIGIIVLFAGVSIAPAISGIDFKSNTNKIEENNENLETAPITIYTFDKSGMKQKEILLPKDIAENISNMFKELEHKFISDPWSDVTQTLGIEFVNILDLYGLIPKGLSKGYVLSLLNPPWVKFLQKILRLTSKTPFLRGPALNFLGNYFNVDNGDMKSILFEKQDFITKYVLLCNLASAGLGIPFPFFMLPRPRGIAAWAASEAYTYVGSLLQTESFLAKGVQQALALGFMGVGLSVYLGLFGYALIGYAAFLVIRAENFENLGPPNQAPVISDENPSSGMWEVPLTLNELSFRISDADGDRMDYTVTTEPNIGSGSGKRKKNGIYKVPVGGLEKDTWYTWTVKVSDEEDTTIKEFNFFTGEIPDLIFFDDFNDNQKDYNKWTEIFTNGTWWEQNQRAEFRLYESGTAQERYEGIESSEFQIVLSETQPLIISADMFGDLGHSSGQFVGYMYVRVTDGTNWIQLGYQRSSDRTFYKDSNDNQWTWLSNNLNKNSWENELQIFSDKYVVRTDDDTSDIIYDTLFSSNPTLTVRIYITLGGDYPSYYWIAGFDNVQVFGHI